MRRVTLQCATLGGVALGGYLLGSSAERSKMIDTLQNVLNTDKVVIETMFDINRPKTLHKFSIFESISAATPFSEPIASGPARVHQFSFYIPNCRIIIIMNVFWFRRCPKSWNTASPVWITSGLLMIMFCRMIAETAWPIGPSNTSRSNR